MVLLSRPLATSWNLPRIVPACCWVGAGGVGRLEFTGTLMLTDSTVQMEIQNKTTYDVLVATGKISVGNTKLDVAFIGNPAFQVGDQMTLVQSIQGNLIGGFQVTAPAPGGGLAFGEQYLDKGNVNR